MNIDKSKLPMHIGFIMDGNGRWASSRNMHRHQGHKAGVKTMQSVVEHCFELGIKCVTVYAFSTENWNRPKEEVDGLFDLVREYLKHTLGNNSKIKKRQHKDRLYWGFDSFCTRHCGQYC